MNVVEEEEDATAVIDSSIGDLEADTSDDESSIASDVTVEPDCDRANNFRFSHLVQRMEMLWQLKFKNKKVTKDQKFDLLLPKKFLKALQPQSAFPIFRLIMSDLDSSRSTYMQEKRIAETYCRAMGFKKGTTAYEMLNEYTNPQKVPNGMFKKKKFPPIDFQPVFASQIFTHVYNISQAWPGTCQSLSNMYSNNGRIMSRPK